MNHDPRSPADAAGSAPRSALRRTLGLWQVAVSGVGVIVGAGIYALIGPAAREAGSALWAAFLLAAATTALTAYAYGRLAEFRPKDSPEFQYASLAFGPTIGFLAGWLMVGATLLASASVALAFGGYFRHLAGTPAVANAGLLLVALGAIALAGIGRSMRLAVVLTAVEAAGLVFIVVLGAPSWLDTNYLEMPRGIAGLSSAAALVFFAYLGFEQLGNLAEEMRRPERDLPRAMVLAITGSTAIYLMVALSAVAVVDWRTLGASEAPLADVARARLGPRADQVLTLVALASTANTVLLVIVSVSRSLYGMAEGGVMPAALGRVDRRGAPHVATAVVVVATLLLILAGDLAAVAAMSDAAILASFMIVNASVPVVAWRQGTRMRRADLVIPVLALVMCAWLLAHVGGVGLLATAVLAAIGLGVRLAQRTPGG